MTHRMALQIIPLPDLQVIVRLSFGVDRGHSKVWPLKMVKGVTQNLERIYKPRGVSLSPVVQNWT